MIEELMKAVLEGAQQQQAGSRQQASPQADILGEILKGVLGGQQQAPQRTSPQSDLGGLADILGGVLGGGRSRGASTGNPIADMAANALAERLGISPQIAGMVVSFAMAMLMGKKMQGAESAPAMPGRRQNQAQRGGVFGGLDLDDLLEGDYAFDSGLAAQLAEKTGQTEEESAYQLQEAVSLLTGAGQKKTKKKTAAKPARKTPTKTKGLDSLLDSWEVD
ncbi:MAG: hypothetical protein AAGD96_18645 [Chloroflexota bacterium]